MEMHCVDLLVLVILACCGQGTTSLVEGPVSSGSSEGWGKVLGNAFLSAVETRNGELFFGGVGQLMKPGWFLSRSGERLVSGILTSKGFSLNL